MQQRGVGLLEGAVGGMAGHADCTLAPDGGSVIVASSCHEDASVTERIR